MKLYIYILRVSVHKKLTLLEDISAKALSPPPTLGLNLNGHMSKHIFFSSSCIQIISFLQKLQAFSPLQKNLHFLRFPYFALYNIIYYVHTGDSIKSHLFRFIGNGTLMGKTITDKKMYYFICSKFVLMGGWGGGAIA